MNGEIIVDLIICMALINIFTLALCVLGFLFEHVIPEQITDKIIEVMFGELPDNYDE